MNPDFFPDDCLSYKIGHSNTLLEIGRELYNVVDTLNLLEYSTTEQSKPIRSIATFNESQRGVEIVGKYETRAPKEISKYFKQLKQVVGYELRTNLFHVEKLNPSPELINISNTSSRLPNLLPSAPSDMYESSYKHGASLWHFDNANPLNNMVLMIYLDEIDGGTCIADPIITPTRDKLAHRQTNIFNTKILSEDITYTEVKGPAGTFSSFNSHILHRAGIPKVLERRAIMVNFLPKEEKYYAAPYRDMDGIND